MIVGKYEEINIKSVKLEQVRSCQFLWVKLNDYTKDIQKCQNKCIQIDL